MNYRPYTPDISPATFNSVIHHPLQSYEWGRFREETGLKVIREVQINGKKIEKAFTLTLHAIPHTSWNIGYLPKGDMPDEALVQTLGAIGRKEKCILMQLEPHVVANENSKFEIRNSKFGLRPAVHPLFTKHTFQLDLTRSEDELLAGMHSKTRYNIRVAEKHGVIVQEDNSPEAFQDYLRLTEETSRRQGFYTHTRLYHEIQWKTLRVQNSEFRIQNFPADYKELSSHLFTATLPTTEDRRPRTLTAWVLFVFHDTLYYPYGASSSEHREAMHSTAMMWEAVRFGKKLGLKTFDLWGALGENPDPKDPWFGFHRFKSGFGPKPVEFIGSYDLVINPTIYKAYAIADKLRWAYLKLKK